MKPALGLAAAAASCAALLAGFWHWFGALGLVFAAPALGVLAWPLVEVVSGLPRLAGRVAMRRHEGRYYAFRGRTMDIHVDGEALCWLRTSDARKIAALPADAVLSRLAPRHCRELGDPVAWRITTDALAQVLEKSSDPEVTKFRDWLERDVARPARNKLARGLAPR